MNRSHHVALIFAISLATNSAIAAEKAAPAQSRNFSQWAGSWVISEEANRLLGFADDASSSDAVSDHPMSFLLSLDKAVGLNIDAKNFAEFRDSLFRPMDHKIVATGKWETMFRVDPGIETDCYVTQHDGHTFLWVGAPYVGMFGGRVVLIQGSNPKHDFLAFNFNAVSSERTPDSAVYRRMGK
jgi:hypothetical protein